MQDKPGRDGKTDIDEALREWGKIEREKISKQTSPSTPNEAARLLQRAKEQEGALEDSTPEDREHHYIEKMIGELKKTRTMSQRITYAQHLTQEFLDKLQHHDPELMDPIITGLKRRPARQEKAESALQRINQRLGEDQSQWGRGY